jgi:hypothetical protein
MPVLEKSQHRWKLELSEPEQITLREGMHHHPHADVRERCAALLKIAEGSSPHWVALHGLLFARDPESIYQWLTWYRQEGLAGILHHRHGGARRGFL